MSDTFEAIGTVAKQDISPLDSIGWLTEETAEFKSWVAQVGRWRNYEPGQFVYHHGDEADGVYGLGSGALDITVPVGVDEPVPIHRADVGFWIGDNADLSHTTRVVSVSAAVPSRLLHLPRPAVARLLERHPQHWRAFYRLSAINVRLAVRMLAESLSLSVRARTARRLLELAARDGQAQITQQELASLVGVTRATMQRCLTTLATQGVIERRYGVVHVLDAAALERLVNAQ